MPMAPISLRSSPAQSTSAEGFSDCPWVVEGMEPSSCPRTLWVLRVQKSFRAATPVSNSSSVQNLVGSSAI